LRNPIYLVMGANGFIGHHLYQHLSKITTRENIIPLGKNQNINNLPNYIQCDVNNTEDIKNKLLPLSFDIIFYLIANTDPTRDIKNFDTIVDFNVDALKNTLNLLVNKKIDRLFFFSTCEVYGNNVFSCSEECLTNPISLYSLSKVMSESLLQFYGNQYALPYTILRPSLIYGIMQDQRYFIPQAIDRLSNYDSFNMTEGEQTRDFIYIDDLCDAVLKILEHKVFLKEIVNISSDNEISLKDLVTKLQSILNTKTIIKFGALPYRKNEIMRYKINNSKLQIHTGWTPKTTLTQGLKTIVNSQEVKK